MIHEPALLFIYLILFCYIIYDLIIGRHSYSRNQNGALILMNSLLAISFFYIFRFILSTPSRPFSEVPAKEHLYVWQILQTALPGLLYIPVKMNRTGRSAEILAIVFPFIVLAITVLYHLIPLPGIFQGISVILLGFPLYLLFGKMRRGFCLYRDEAFILLVLFPVVVLLISALLLVRLSEKITESLVMAMNLWNIPVFIKYLPMSMVFSYEDIGVEMLDVPEEGRYMGQGDVVRINDLRDRILKYFEEEKPYLKADLTIHEVALYLYSNKTYISRVINDSFGLNFNQFVNKFRIEEAKRLYGKNRALSVNRLCALSGFGSMATFTISFRIFTGTSPAEWCKNYRIKNGEKEK